MKIITLLTCIFVFSINAVALNIGTTNIVFTYEDTSLTLEQQAIVSNCVDKLLTPILLFATLDDYGDNNIALYLSNRSCGVDHKSVLLENISSVFMSIHSLSSFLVNRHLSLSWSIWSKGIYSPTSAL